MKSYIFYFVFLYLFIQANLKLSPEKKEELLRKFTTKITSDSLEYIQPQYDYDISPTISYNAQDIEEKVLNKYQFPRNYDFFNSTGCEKRVKNQGKCGSCWSFSATTALSYRYFQKYNVTVDLSPQDGVSCYIKDCAMGNYLTDSQMNLIKNGTVTESCFPYTSKNGSIEECIDQCKDETEEYKKYYAQNMYTIEDEARNENNFLDVVTLIIDELITNGPLSVRYNIYEDFYSLENKSMCGSDYVYTYDEKSEFLGGHGVVIVGYGFQNNKFYWLIQNSWGYDFCDDGFIKIEFGQVGIEEFAFSEPYFHKENVTEKKNISINFVEQDGICRLQVETNSNTSDWVNTLEIKFRNEERSYDFIYHCNKIILKTEGEGIICYNELWNYYAYRGTYKIHSYSSLGDENEFVLDEEFKKKEFYYLGYNMIFSEINEYYFISDEGSRILMYYFRAHEEEEIKLPTLYADSESQIPLSNCHFIEGMSGGGFSYIYCDIAKEELDYFQEFTWEEDDRYENDLTYYVMCGMLASTSTYIYRLNKTQYPVFTITDFQFEKVEKISNKTIFTLMADIDGNQDVDKKGENNFINFVNIENNGENETYDMLCNLDESFNITCELFIKDATKYDNVYLLPYYYPYDYTYPTELIIKNEIKANIIEPPIPEEEEEQIPETEEEEKIPEPEEEESIEPEPEEEESIKPEPEEEESVEPEPEEEEESIEPEPEEEESIEPEPEEEESIEPEPKEEEEEEKKDEDNSEEEEEEDNPPTPPSPKKSSSNTTRTLIIVFCVVGGIIIVGLVAFFIIRILGRKKINVEDIEKDSASQKKLLDSNELKE